MNPTIRSKRVRSIALITNARDERFIQHWWRCSVNQDQQLFVVFIASTAIPDAVTISWIWLISTDPNTVLSTFQSSQKSHFNSWLLTESCWRGKQWCRPAAQAVVRREVLAIQCGEAERMLLLRVASNWRKRLTVLLCMIAADGVTIERLAQVSTRRPSGAQFLICHSWNRHRKCVYESNRYTVVANDCFARGNEFN